MDCMDITSMLRACCRLHVHFRLHCCSMPRKQAVGYHAPCAQGLHSAASVGAAAAACAELVELDCSGFSGVDAFLEVSPS